VSVERIVVDASAALKWYLHDEDHKVEADAMQNDLFAGKIALLVPTLFDYEIANALKVAVLKRRITQQFAEISLQGLHLLPVRRYPASALLDSALSLAFSHQRSVYDASYLSLAEAHAVDFYTGDKRMFNAMQQVPGNKFDWVKWIGDYQTR
jgi:predicted nucleic acid-binding protein